MTASSLSREARKMHYLQDDGLQWFTLCGRRSPQSFNATSSERSVTCAKCRKAMKLKSSEVR